MRILILIILVLNLIHEKSSFANNANQTIESFGKAKKILKKIHLEKPFTFYCQCKYEKNKPGWKSCVFLFKKNKKEHLELNGSMFYQLRILVLNLILGKKGTPIV